MQNLQKTIANFLTAKRAEGRKETTITWYGQQLTRYRNFADPNAWSETNTIRAFLADLRSQTAITHAHQSPRPDHLSPATLRAYHRSLRIFFAWCVAENLIDRNPMQRIKPPPRPRPLAKDISTADALAILQQAQHSARDYALVLFLADTGCRDGELRTLQLPDLDLTQHCATVTGKGNKQRRIYFCAATAAALTTWLPLRPPGSPYLFPSQKTNAQLQRGAIAQLLRRLALKANVTGRCNPHAWRHHFATRFLETGGDVEALRELLGHESIATTQIYVHLRADSLRRLHDAHTPVNGLKDALIRTS